MASLYEQKSFEVLGLTPSADAQAVRAAYRQKVKACHPDQFTEPEKQRLAQEQLIQLNLAYEEALKIASQHRVGFNLISQEEAKHFAQRLIDQGNLESALRQLNRADSKDDDWYFMQGNILMGLRQYETAHQSYREAVRRAPDNRTYREGALNAALAMKKNKPLGEKLQGWVLGALGKK
ncbi:MAG: DnaJ domain-containing protein [Clostridia bacterium]